ncbi:MAG: DUF1631 family protein [Gammaproteobacteria bacterium]|jgi:hypothetical protein
MNKRTPSALEKPADLQDLDTLEKIRWSLRQRLCEHMRRLNSDLFDELDDFLFCSVQPDELSEASPQLKLIREFRNKKQLFEEKFLVSIDGALQSTLVPEVQDRKLPAAIGVDSTGSSAYEKMEADLALERMQRKAFKFYASRIRELGSSGTDSEHAEENGENRVIPENRDILIKNTLRALAFAQPVFRVPLESRLVFLKLFEQHFLLKMDKLYQDVISIINNKDNQKFVERLYASSTSIHKRRSRSQLVENRQGAQGSRSRELFPVSNLISARIEGMLDEWCKNPKLPEFVVTMLRQDWQNVLFLLGLNKGVEAQEWHEARQAIDRLVQLLSGETATQKPAGDSEKEWTVTQVQALLRQGFDFVHKDAADQEAFFNALGERLNVAGRRAGDAAAAGSSQPSANAGRGASNNFAAVSEAGRKILDSADLDDFIALLSDDQEQAIAEVEEEAISMDYYLTMVDSMADGAAAELRHADEMGKCRIRKSNNIENSYQVLDKNGRVLLTRGRVGLAVSLRAGEIRLEGQEDFNPAPSVSPPSLDVVLATRQATTIN